MSVCKRIIPSCVGVVTIKSPLALKIMFWLASNCVGKGKTAEQELVCTQEMSHTPSNTAPQSHERCQARCLPRH